MSELHHDSALSVRLPRALRDELDELARRLSSEVAVVTTAEVVRLLIREGLTRRSGKLCLNPPDEVFAMSVKLGEAP